VSSQRKREERVMRLIFTNLRTGPLLVAMLWLSACGGGGVGGNSDAAPPLVGVRLPQTGQTNCYDNTAPPQPVTCSTAGIPPGQGGATNTGVAWPNPRFVVGTGAAADCVTDNLTGLMWARNANLPAGTRTWQQALAFANDLDLCGLADWRLPNRKELRSLVNYGEGDPATWLNAQAQGFTNVQAGDYWSSSSVAGSAGSAWFIRMDVGGFVLAGNKSTSNFVWPVRAGQ
jgi:hypothetical protein